LFGEGEVNEGGFKHNACAYSRRRCHFRNESIRAVDPAGFMPEIRKVFTVASCRRVPLTISVIVIKVITVKIIYAMPNLLMVTVLRQ